jgi:hypothetical protein
MACDIATNDCNPQFYIPAEEKDQDISYQLLKLHASITAY